MKYIEIQTCEGGRLDWVAVFGSTEDSQVLDWGNRLLSGFPSKALVPNLRVTAGLRGPVVGAWRSEGYEAVSREL